MAAIKWNDAGSRVYETGVQKGVLYLTDESGKYSKGVAWNGLVSVNESPSGAEPTPLYASDSKYVELMSAEEFGASIEAYTYPVEFEACDGSAEIDTGIIIGQQPRSMFGLCYRTTMGNDTAGNEYGYKLHLIYGAKAAPTEKAYTTINDSPEAITFSWELTTTPVEVSGFKPTASITIDSTRVTTANMAKIEELLYGTSSKEASLPMPSEILALVKPATMSAGK